MTRPSPPDGPLAGLRVLDLTRVLAGPLCTMTLGDLGAHVLKVERPNGGDATRGWGPPFADDGESAYYRAINRNKVGLAADLDDPADARLLRDLAGGADVVVDSTPVGPVSKVLVPPKPTRSMTPALPVTDPGVSVWPVVLLASSTAPARRERSTNSDAWNPGIEPVWPTSSPEPPDSSRGPSP